MAEALEMHKQPPPDFDNTSPEISKVIMFASGYSDAELREMSLNERQVKAIRYLQINKTITNAQYQQLFAASKPTASRDLTEMAKLMLISKVGTTGKGTSYVLVERKGLAKGSIESIVHRLLKLSASQALRAFRSLAGSQRAHVRLSPSCSLTIRNN